MIKIIATTLLSVFVVLLLTASLAIAAEPMPTTMEHDGCFSETCGPVQHLLHISIIPDNLSSRDNYSKKTIIQSKVQKPTYLITSPDTPPPKISFV